MRKKNKTKTIMILVTEEFKNRVHEAAIRDNKTLTGYVTDCLLLDLEKKEKKNGTDKD